MATLEVAVGRPNRAVHGWADYFQPSHVSLAWRALDRRAAERVPQRLYRQHKVRSGKYVRFPDTRLCTEFGLARLAPRTARFPWVKA